MALSPLVSGQDLTDYSAGFEAQAIAFASALVRNATGQTLSLVTDDTVTLRGGKSKLLLPEFPVVSVKNVTGKYYATTADPFYYEIYDVAALYGPIPAGVWVQDADGRLLLPVGASWPPVVTLTYTHGYETVPDDLKMVVTAVASRMLDNPLADQTKTTGGVSTGLAPTDLTMYESMIVSRYRRMTSS